MRNLENYESVSNLKPLLGKKPPARCTNNDLSETPHETPKQPYRVQSGILGDMNFGSVEGWSNYNENNMNVSVQELESQSDVKDVNKALKDDDIIIQMHNNMKNEKKNTQVKNPGRTQSVLYNADNDDKEKGRKRTTIQKGTKVAITDYRIRCTNINNRIKQYVEVLFQKYDDEKDGRLTYIEFLKWLKLHPKMLDTYEKTFEVHIWRKTNHPDTNKPILSFRLKEPEFRCRCDIRHGDSNKKKHWIEIHWKLLLVFKNEEDDTPIISKYLDLLRLEEKKDKNGVPMG